MGYLLLNLSESFFSKYQFLVLLLESLTWKNICGDQLATRGDRLATCCGLATYSTTTVGQKIYILQRREFSDYGNTPPWLHKYVIRKDQRALPSRNLILTTALKEPTTKLIRVAAVRGCAPLPASIAPDDS